jgi:hypothetical protein
VWRSEPVNSLLSTLPPSITSAVDYERRVQTSDTFIEIAMIRLLVGRLGRQK